MKFKNLKRARRNLQIQIISLKKAVKHWHQFYTVSFKKQKREEYLSIHFIKLLLPWHQNRRNTIKKTSGQYLSSVQSLSHVQLFVTPWTAALQASLSSPTHGGYSNSCPSSWWCHPAISSSVVPFFSHLQFFPASGSFPRSQFFASGGQSIGASASASVLPVNIQDWFSLGNFQISTLIIIYYR